MGGGEASVVTGPKIPVNGPAESNEPQRKEMRFSWNRGKEENVRMKLTAMLYASRQRQDTRS